MYGYGEKYQLAGGVGFEGENDPPDKLAMVRNPERQPVAEPSAQIDRLDGTTSNSSDLTNK